MAKHSITLTQDELRTILYGLTRYTKFLQRRNARRQSRLDFNDVIPPEEPILRRRMAVTEDKIRSIAELQDRLDKIYCGVL